MATKQPTPLTLRLPPPLLARIDACVDQIRQHPELVPEITERTRTVTRAAVARELLLQGLEAMERRARREGKQ